MDHPIKLIVGLGNPGKEYFRTRHNMGADLVAAIASNSNCTLQVDNKFFGLSGAITLENQSIRLLIPTTYMNLSGKSVSAFAQFYKLVPENILIVHDELDLAPGKTRLKRGGGGHGGHNGLKDIIKSLGNNKNFPRLRIGIGHPGHAKQVSHYVLKKAPIKEQEAIDNSMIEAINILSLLVKNQWNDAMKILHTKPL